MLRQPELIVEEIERQKGGSSLLEEEMARLRTSIQRLADQEKRLIRLFGIGQITEEFLLREVEQVKKAREAQEKELSGLKQQQAHLRKLDGVGEKVKAYCAKVGERLTQLDFDEKRLAFQALQIKVIADRAGARLVGAIPTSYATIEQTSGCMYSSDVDRVPFESPLAMAV